MANYISKNDLLKSIPEKLLVQITDDENVGNMQDSLIDEAIKNAEGEADGYLSTRYTVPLSPVPQIIKKVCVDIAIYNLYARRLGAPEDRRQRYEDAIKFLAGVSKGAVSLGSNAPEPADTGTAVSVKSQDRIFARDSLKGF